jgi:molybdopterin synthase catalytic subunit/molybdopterin synthase sulfur carrier subunit
MIRVRVTFFALARDLAGAGNADVELPAGATNATLLAALVGRYPALATLAGHLRFAVNNAYVPGDHALGDGDEVAVIPPVSGG